MDFKRVADLIKNKIVELVLDAKSRFEKDTRDDYDKLLAALRAAGSMQKKMEIVRVRLPQYMTPETMGTTLKDLDDFRSLVTAVATGRTSLEEATEQIKGTYKEAAQFITGLMTYYKLTDKQTLDKAKANKENFIKELKKIILAADHMEIFNKPVADELRKFVESIKPEEGEERAKSPVSEEEKKITLELMVKAVHLIALRLIETDRIDEHHKYYELMKKYFIEKRVPRQNTVSEEKLSLVDATNLEEELSLVDATSLEEEEKEEKEEEPKTNISQKKLAAAANAGNDINAAVLDAVTTVIEVKPQDATKSYESLLRFLFKGKKFKRPDVEIIKRMGDKASKPLFSSNLRNIKFLIFRGVGMEVKQAKDLANSNPFKNISMDSFKLPTSPTKVQRGPLEESGLQPRILDLNQFKGKQLDEGLLGMFGAWVEYALKGIFGGWGTNLKVLGSKRDVEAFARTLGGEAKYIQAAKRHGLDHPTTYKNKASLDTAVKNFEKETGIKWPFK